MRAQCSEDFPEGCRNVPKLCFLTRDKLAHIVEKRPDSRERYVQHAIDTLTGPFEVWKVLYDNGGFRLAFINAYEAKNDMLVVVDVRNGHVLWNFMHAPSRAMNKHRQGDLLYKRYILQDKEKGSQLAALDIRILIFASSGNGMKRSHLAPMLQHR